MNKESIIELRSKRLFSTGQDEENAFSMKDLNINGRDVMKIKDIEPSPEVGEILNYLLEKVIEELSLK